jgi:hypothetical protein
MAKRTVKLWPDGKILETFLDFAAPLLSELPSEDPERKIRAALEVAFTAWNAVIMADVLNDQHYLDQIRRLTADAAGPARVVEQMIARKRDLFGDDHRLIGTWHVTRTPECINLHADARDPHSLPRSPADHR